MAELMDRLATGGYQSFTDGEKMFFSLWWFQVEPNNGGLHQFFFNDSGAYSGEVLVALERIGANQTADILRRAMAFFPDNQVPVGILERRRVLCDLPDELQWDKLSDLTTELYQSEEGVANLFESYTKSHPKMFSGESRNDARSGS